jgi:hypothetical protein
MIEHLKAELRTVRAWVNTLLLALFPFADQIVAAANDNLPALAPYLPANVYKWVGLALVLFNMGIAMSRIRKAVGNG